jgi:AcrR family transcriptional regulator
MAIIRNPTNTRLTILQAAFNEMHLHGFQGMRIDNVLKQTSLKKGALYHHFSSKQALGYAVLEEAIQQRIRAIWIEPLSKVDDPLNGIIQIFTEFSEQYSPAMFKLGCPLNNLAQEMSPIDEGFRTRIQAFYQEWQNAIATALQAGKEKEIIRPEVNCDDAACFILTVIEGSMGMAKNAQNSQVYLCCGTQLNTYLQTLASRGSQH